ncbi:MAG: CopG family transcriptional regulator [Acidimicrobiales bacterium]
MDRTNIYLERRQTETLDRLAADEGVSRAEIIRRLLDQALDGVDDSMASDLAAIDRSYGALRDADVADRASGEREEHLGRVWRQA